MAVISIANLVPRIRKILGDEPFEDYIIAQATSIITSASNTTGSFFQPTAWSEGDVAEVDNATGEQLKVRVAGSNPISFKRAHNNTTASASHAAADVVLQNPRWGYDEITNAASRVVESLWPHVWKRATTTVGAVAGTYIYALAVTDCVDIVGVTQKLSSTESVRYGLTNDDGGSQGLPVVVERDHDTFTATAGKVALRFPNGPKSTSAATIDVVYRAVITTSDIEETTGIAECVSVGAAAKLLRYADVQRSAGNVKLKDDVQPGIMTQMALELEKEHAMLKQQLFNYFMRVAPPAVLQKNMGDFHDPAAEAFFNAAGGQPGMPYMLPAMPQVAEKQSLGAQ